MYSQSHNPQRCPAILAKHFDAILSSIRHLVFEFQSGGSCPFLNFGAQCTPLHPRFEFWARGIDLGWTGPHTLLLTMYNREHYAMSRGNS